VPAGGTVSLQALERLQAEGQRSKSERQSSTITKSAAYTVFSGVAAQNVTDSKEVLWRQRRRRYDAPYCCAEPTGTSYQTVVHRQIPVLNTHLNATEPYPAVGWSRANSDAFVTDQPFLWKIPGYLLSEFCASMSSITWAPNCSAALIDSYFAACRLLQWNHDTTV